MKPGEQCQQKEQSPQSSWSFGSYFRDVYNIGCDFYNLLKKSIREGSLLEWRDTSDAKGGETKELPEVDEEPCRVAYIDPVFKKVCDPLADAIVKCGEMIDRAKPAQQPPATTTAPQSGISWSPSGPRGIPADARKVTIDLRPFQKRAPEAPSSPEASLRSRVAPAAPVVAPAVRHLSGKGPIGDTQRTGFSGQHHSSRHDVAGFSVPTAAGKPIRHQTGVTATRLPRTEGFVAPTAMHPPSVNAAKSGPAHDLSSFYRPKPFHPSAMQTGSHGEVKHAASSEIHETHAPAAPAKVTAGPQEPTTSSIGRTAKPYSPEEHGDAPSAPGAGLSGREKSDLEFIPKRAVAQIRKQWPPPSNAEGADYEREIFIPKPKDEETVYTRERSHMQSTQHKIATAPPPPPPPEQKARPHGPTDPERTHGHTTAKAAIPMPPPVPPHMGQPHRHPAEHQRTLPQATSVTLPFPKPFHAVKPATLPRGRHESASDHFMQQFDNIHETFVPGRRAEFAPASSLVARSREKARSVEPGFDFINRAPKPWKPVK